MEGPPADLLVKALMAAGKERPGDDANDVVMFSHFLVIILDHLDQNPVVPELQVVELEWRYFALLRHGTRPPRRLSKALATYPEFFVQLVCLLYGPSPESGVQEPEPEDRVGAESLASHAFHVLHEWSWVPGADRAAPSTETPSMRGSRRPGSSVRKGGVRKPATVRSAISSPPRRGRGLRRGRRRLFGMRLSNVVAARSSADLSWGSSIDRESPVRLPLAGGDQERDWADYFRDQARRFEVSWDRTAQLLDRVADMYEAYARHQDEWTEQREA